MHLSPRSVACPVTAVLHEQSSVCRSWSANNRCEVKPHCEVYHLTCIWLLCLCDLLGQVVDGLAFSCMQGKRPHPLLNVML